ncbi:MAG: YdcF family protein [Desulfomonile tiedjei]|nr:YdcF family protein [Desulfomonile tiedjei]
MELLLFLAKKAISTIIYPVGSSLALWIAGLVLLRVRPRSRAGFLLVLAGGLWLLVAALPVTGVLLLKPLESKAGSYANPQQLSRAGVKYIVVLGGDIRGGELTTVDRIACSSLVRVMEGIRLWRGVPGSRLVLSGGTYSSETMPSAEGMAALALELGVPPEAIVKEISSLDTDDEARLLSPVLGKGPFALVTSACHMRRSLLIFRSMGLDAIPAPADFEVKKVALDLRYFLPSAMGLEKTHKAIHEYIGTLVVLMKGSRAGSRP